MTEIEAATVPPIVVWGVASRPMPGNDVSGDRHLVTTFPGGVLIAVIDGLGHGPPAALASTTAVAVLEAHASGDIVDLVYRCHEALAQTRGVVMTIVTLTSKFNEERGVDDVIVSWVSVGNVEGALFLQGSGPVARSHLIGVGGIVGSGRLPALRVSDVTIADVATLVLATDGVSSSFVEGVELDGNPQPIADDLLDGFGKQSDDALVLAARWIGHR